MTEPTPDTLTASAVEAAADLGRRAADATNAVQDVDPYNPNRSVTIRRVRDDENVEVLDAEPHLDAPRRARGGAVLDWPDSFAVYVTRLHAGGPTTLWADEDDRQVTAVFNDHHTTETPGWRDHTVTYQARVDPDWSAWRARDGKLSAQTDFGEFLEEHLHSVVEVNGSPAAATMLEVAMSLNAKRNVTFESSSRLQSGDVEFEFRETTQAQAGRVTKIEVPERFVVQLSPFVGLAPVQLQARLRYRADREGLRIGFRLLRPDLAEREAFHQVTQQIAVGTPEEVPLLFGSAPGSLRPGRFGL